MEGGVAVPGEAYLPENATFITGAFLGMRPYNVDHLLNNLRMDFYRIYGQCGFLWNNHQGYVLQVIGSPEELQEFLEVYKKTVEVWAADIRFSTQYQISEAGGI